MQRKIESLVLAILLFGLVGCKKYLDEKPTKTLVVPATLNDLQALLDYYPKMNTNDAGSGDVSADDYYLTPTDWAGLTESFRRMYVWEKDFLFDPINNDWGRTYERVYYANTVLEALEKIEADAAQSATGANVKGQALFARGRSLLQAAFLWCQAYDNAAAGEPGLPLRVSPDFNQSSVRATLGQTYDAIIADLKEAVALLPVTPLHKMRASKPAAYGLLARTFLAMRRYDQAGLYADSCLQLYSSLIDFNTLNPSAAYPFTQFNPEDIFHSSMTLPAPLVNSRARIDSLLYQSYAINDLRKQLYFKNNNNGSYAFKGSYEGNGTPYTGVSVGEAYLVRAECAARTGNVSGAVNDLNTLLRKRWKTATFVPFTAASADQALTLVLQERRKELLFRGLRWMDIKRLNREGAALSLTRNTGGPLYSLSANSPRYVLPIPEDVIELSGMTQNPR